MTTFRQRHFTEEVGLLFQTAGGQRMLGRVLGWLMISDPEHQSAAQLAEALDVSAGSISMTMRQLVQSGMVEKVAFPGDRTTYFRVRPGVWVDTMRARMGFLKLLIDLADRGLATLEGEPEARKARLAEMRAFHVFLDTQMPALLDAWQAQRGKEDR